LVVAVGGDGTLNETVNGILLAGRRAELATLPIGTGMDFVRTYGIPKRFDDAVRVALSGRSREIDAGRVRYRSWSGDEAERFYANVGSAGMSGAVAQRANSMSKALGGKATFFYALVRVFATWRNSVLEVAWEGGSRRAPMHDVVVANGQWHGGGMWLAPEAQPDDGLLDVLLIGDITRPDFARSALRIYRGTHLSHPKVDLVRTPWVTIDAGAPLPIELDGEQPGTTPARFSVMPRALSLRVPAS
jgi:YegS/Rv2252/BmrU family lipid kinase